MPNHTTKRSSKTGLPPGSLVYVGEKKVDRVKITGIDYDKSRYEKKSVERIEETFTYKDTSTISWINIDGLHDINILESISRHYNIHTLVLEDILSTHQRPKVEILDDYIFGILKMISYDHEEEEINVEQISLILGKNFVITFQEAQGDIFDPLRARIEGGKGRARKSGSDYLAYAIMDIVVDHYFLVLENLGERIEDLEEAVLEDHDSSVVEKIHILKRQLIDLRKLIWPLREVISSLQRDESPLIKKATSRFLSDLYDHIVQIIDTLETYREMVSSLLDIYLTMVSNRMNEVMKVLTIIATIFIPLSFLAGVYGMNFDTGISPFNMPELEFPFGYLMFWGLAVLVAGGLLMYFKRKRWL